MKKVLISALAVGMLTACSQDETISQQSPMQISFEGAFVENATRGAIDPSTTTTSIDNFDVWAFMDESTGVVFNDEDVTKTDGKWGYDNTQYWAPDHTYYFAALSPMNSKNVTESLAKGEYAKEGLGNIMFYNIDGTEDLLYAKAKVTTGSEMTSNPGPVKFQFQHLLSKVKFSFTNGFLNDNNYITVSNIRMSAPKRGQIVLGKPWLENQGTANVWRDLTESITLSFGDMITEKLAMSQTTESDYERLTIPADESQEYEVVFDVVLYNGDQIAYSNTMTTTIEDVALEMGKAYNFHATIDASNIVPGTGELYKIEFEAEVDEWVNGNLNGDKTDGGTINTEKIPVLAEEYLTVKAENTMTLTGSAVIPSTLSVLGELNGAGYTLFAAETPTNNGLVRPSGTATVKNVTINGNNKSTAAGAGMRGIYITAGGTYTIDNVTVEDVTYAISVNTTAAVTLNVTNSTLEGWTSYGSSTTATFTNVNFTVNPDAYGNFKPYGNTILEDCVFESGFYLDLSALTGTLTIKNCKVGETVITADNIEDLFDDNIEDYTKVKNQVTIE